MDKSKEFWCILKSPKKPTAGVPGSNPGRLINREIYPPHGGNEIGSNVWFFEGTLHSRYERDGSDSGGRRW